MNSASSAATDNFNLFLFTADPQIVKQVSAAGISGFVIDWENKGKMKRQAGYNTQINSDTPESLLRIRSLTSARIICRINRVEEGQKEWKREVDVAMRYGADEILLPMVRTVSEVETVLRYVDNQCGVGILVETLDAVRLAPELSRLPLARAYVGLYDLCIDRRSQNLFLPMIDGTAEDLSRQFRCSFGFAGLTEPDLGYPVPCRLLIAEMARLRCRFTFLRRSFFADAPKSQMSDCIARILSKMAEAYKRSPADIENDRAELTTVVASLSSEHVVSL